MLPNSYSKLLHFEELLMACCYLKQCISTGIGVQKCFGTCSVHKGLSSTRNYKFAVSLHVKIKWKMFAFCQSYEEMRGCHSPRASQSLVTYEHFFWSYIRQFPLRSIAITPLMNYRESVQNLFLLPEIFHSGGLLLI